MNNKTNAIDNWLQMIFKSWTWEKLTNEEKARFIDLLKNQEKQIKGTYKQRWEILQIIYHSFLIGLNYKPIGWRESEEESLPF